MGAEAAKQDISSAKDIRVEPIKKHIGARVFLDKSQLGDPDVGAECMALLEKYQILVFPKINVTDEEQLKFTDSLGRRLNFSKKVDGGKGGTPDIYRVTLNSKINTQQEYVKGTYFWHMDGLTVPEQPPKATILSGRILSAKGGDTHFCNTYAGYAGLADEIKAEIEDLRVVHSLTPYLTAIVEKPTEDELARWNSNPINTWPLVWKHKSGRKSLVMSATGQEVVGMDLASSKALIARLMEWTAQPDYTYVHKWSQGDMVMWDNYGVMHRVTPYAVDSGREMHRTTIEATERLQ
jgi:alpha-ketoglutarate-dependent taurine dioxygenase